VLHHTDRGSPYASEDYAFVLRSHGFIASMSRTGDCYDNAVVESFFGSLKAELACDVYPSRVVASATTSRTSTTPNRADVIYVRRWTRSNYASRELDAPGAHAAAARVLVLNEVGAGGQ
jgi:transposase InsO family protein